METVEEILAEMEAAAGAAGSPEDEVSTATVREWVARIRAARSAEAEDAWGDALDRGE